MEVSSGIEGVIEIATGYAVPTWKEEFEDTINGMDSLQLMDGKLSIKKDVTRSVDGVKPAKVVVKPKRAVKVAGKRARGGRNKKDSRMATPNQRLISDMLGDNKKVNEDLNNELNEGI